MNPRYIYRSEQYNCQMNELMFQAGVKGMSERSELIPCNNYYYNIWAACIRGTLLAKIDVNECFQTDPSAPLGSPHNY